MLVLARLEDILRAVVHQQVCRALQKIGLRSAKLQLCGLQPPLLGSALILNGKLEELSDLLWQLILPLDDFFLSRYRRRALR